MSKLNECERCTYPDFVVLNTVSNGVIKNIFDLVELFFVRLRHDEPCLRSIARQAVQTGATEKYVDRLIWVAEIISHSRNKIFSPTHPSSSQKYATRLKSYSINIIEHAFYWLSSIKLLHILCSVYFSCAIFGRPPRLSRLATWAVCTNINDFDTFSYHHSSHLHLVEDVTHSSNISRIWYLKLSLSFSCKRLRTNATDKWIRW